MVRNIMLDGQIREVEDDDKIVQVLFITTFYGKKVALRVDAEKAAEAGKIRIKVSQEVYNKFQALSEDERKKVLEDFGGCSREYIKPMLLSDYVKIPKDSKE